MVKILILLLYNQTEHYDKLINYWRCYSKYHSNIDVYFITADKQYITNTLIDDIFYVPVEESYKFGILVKFIEALEYFKGYDYVFRASISTFVNLIKLYEFCQTREPRAVYRGVYIQDSNCQYASGIGFLLSADIIQFIIDHQTELDYYMWDDMALGIFLNQYYTLEVIPYKIIETAEDSPSSKYEPHICFYRIKIPTNRSLEYKFHEYFIDIIYYPELNYQNTKLDTYFKLAKRVKFDSTKINIQRIINGLIKNGQYTKSLTSKTNYNIIETSEDYETYIGEGKPDNRKLNMIITEVDYNYRDKLANYRLLDTIENYMIFIKDSEPENLIGAYVINGHKDNEIRLKHLGLTNIHFIKTDEKLYDYYTHSALKITRDDTIRIIAYFQALKEFMMSNYKYGYFTEGHNLFPSELKNIFTRNVLTYVLNNKYGLFVSKDTARQLLADYDRPFAYWADDFTKYLKQPLLDSEKSNTRLDLTYVFNNPKARINFRRLSTSFTELLAKPSIVDYLVFDELDVIYYHLLKTKTNYWAFSDVREYIWCYGLKKEYRSLFDILYKIFEDKSYTYRYHLESETWCDKNFKKLNNDIQKGTIIKTKTFPDKHSKLAWCLIPNMYIKLVLKIEN